ncbi:MAG: glycosyltransferase [Chromatiales bacterium]|nr:glycosyltransferase [Chromatiales bacterium]
MNRSVLLIAFHYPPLATGSGLQRTLGFSRHLPAFGWQPIVLAPHPRAYARVAPGDADALVPPGVIVERSFVLDAARHLSVAGRYPHRAADPDRWATWRWSAVRAALRLIRRHRPAAIWSTYPIATTMRIGMEVARRSGLPWIADFRDPMTDDGFPPEPERYRRMRAIEDAVLARANIVTVTTPGAARAFAARRGGQPVAIIENAFDESDFAGLPAVSARAHDAPFTLLHSGTLYPNERDPRVFFDALAALREAGDATERSLRVVLRATQNDAVLKPMLRERGLERIVELAGPLPYRDALAEMCSADALLLLQASNCNAQIPAKLYEYLRANRPILALTDPAGDTAWRLAEFPIARVAPLDGRDAIAAALRAMLACAGSDHCAAQEIAVHSREARTREFARLLDSLVREARSR